MYQSLNSEQYKILKLIGDQIISLELDIAILDGTELSGIKYANEILEEFVRNGLFYQVKPFNELAERDVFTVNEVFGAYRMAQIDTYTNPIVVHVTEKFLPYWDEVELTRRMKERVKKHGGVSYEMEYDWRTNNLIIHAYCRGVDKLVIHFQSGKAPVCLLEYLMDHPNVTVHASEIRDKIGSISKIISSFGLPKTLKDLFFKYITEESVMFIPKIYETQDVCLDLESLEYLGLIE